MTLQHLVDSLSQQAHAPLLDKLALSVETSPAWTYRQLSDRVAFYGRVLEGAGVAQGDRIGLFLHNCLDYWAIYLAAAQHGVVSVRINFRLSEHELRFVIADSGSRVIFAGLSLAESLAQVQGDLPQVHGILVDDLVHGAGESVARAGIELATEVADRGGTGSADRPLPAADRPLALIYTSGTTGMPKGVVWTHGNAMWHAAAQAMEWSIGPGSVTMTTGPMYHVGAFENLLLPALVRGGHAVMTRSRGFDIRRVLTTIAELRVTDVLIYPFMLKRMLELTDLANYDLSCLNRIVTGGSRLQDELLEEFQRRLPVVELVPTYGLTEGGSISTLGYPQRDHADLTSAGWPMPLTALRIACEDGTQAEVGEVGEVWVKSPASATAYWQNPEETANTFVDGWCRTGDLGRLDEFGQLFIAGRLKDTIRTGGENVHAVEVERALNGHPAVADSAVFGVADPELEEAICAAVVVHAGQVVDAEELIQYVKGQIASYKKPKHVVIVDELPRTLSGKVLKARLRDAHGPRFAGSGSTHSESASGLTVEMLQQEAP